jgi:hypothetical protein
MADAAPGGVVNPRFGDRGRALCTPAMCWARRRVRRPTITAVLLVTHAMEATHTMEATRRWRPQGGKPVQAALTQIQNFVERTTIQVLRRVY